MKYTVYGVYANSGEKVEVGTYETLEEAEWNLRREIDALRVKEGAFESAEIVGYTESAIEIEDDDEEDYELWDDEQLEDFRNHNAVLMSSLELYIKREQSVDRERAREIYETVSIEQKKVVSEMLDRYYKF